MSYISSLNLLGDDSPVPISEEALNEELSIWANAQFTFDTKPGSAIQDDSYKITLEHSEDLFAALTNLGNFNENNNDQNDDLLASYLNNNNNNNNQYLLPTSLQQLQPQQPVLPKIAPAQVQPNTTNSILPITPIQTPITPIQTPITPSIKKRKSTLTTKELNEEEREAIEEDKRRRNTAASARFRMKKKLREQALEKTAKEMTHKVEVLERRVQELEKEAKWLRALVLEKDPSLLNNMNTN